MEDMVLVPVGKAVQVPFPTGASPVALVRRGAHVFELPATAFTLWASLHPPMRRSELLGAAGAAGLREAPEALAYLTGMGLVARMDAGEEDWGAVFSTYKAVPLGEGMGELAGEPGWYGVAVGDRMAIKMRAPGYLVWAKCDGSRPLSDAVDDVAEGINEEAGELAAAVKSQLPAWLEAGAAYLDAA